MDNYQDLVAQCRAGLLPVLKEWEARLSSEYGAVSVNVYDFPTPLSLDGHCVGIDCAFKKAGVDAADVGLCVEIFHVRSSPVIHADVVWGHPSGQFEAELFDGPIAATAQRIDEVISRLPELISALRRALHRGCPNQKVS